MKTMFGILAAALTLTATAAFADQICGNVQYTCAPTANGGAQCEYFIDDAGGDAIYLNGEKSAVGRLANQDVCVEGRYTDDTAFEVASIHKK